MRLSRSTLATLAIATVLACPTAGRAEPPTVQQRDTIEDYFAPNFVLPQTSLWQFADVKPYIGGQTLICGKVNFQSAMRQYQGFRRFFAALDHGHVASAQIDNTYEDPSGRLSAKLDLLCGKA